MNRKPTYKALEERIKELERKISENMIDKKEQFYGALFERASDSIFIMEEYRFIECNKMTLQMFGCEKEEDISGFYPWHFSPSYQPDGKLSKEKATELIDAALKGKVQRFYWKHIRKDGTPFDAEVSLSLLEIRDKKLLHAIVRDVTGRNRAEEELRNSEARQSLILGSLPMAFYVAQPFGDYGGTWVSEQIDQISGFTSELFLADKNLWASRLHPEDRERVFAAFDSLLHKNTISVEYRWQAADGSYLWFQDSSVLVRDENDGPKEIIGTWLDITERRRAESALRESEKKYKSFIEEAPIGMYTINTRGEITYANRKVVEMTGYKAEDWLNRSFYPIVHPEDMEIVLNRIQMRLEGKGTPAPQEIRIFHSSGKTMWVKFNVESIYDTDENGSKKIVGMQTFVEDITERKLAESALLESEKRLELALKGADLGLWDRNIQTGEVIRNERAAELYGYSMDEMDSNVEIWESSIHPEDRQRVMELRNRHIEGATPMYEAEYRLHTRSGEWKWILSRGKVVDRDKNGNPLRIAGTLLDITERKRSEEDRTRLETQLVQAQKMETIGTLAGGIAHDFNNILSAVIGYTEVSMLQAQEGSKLYNNLQEVLKAGDRAKELVMQILTFSRQTEKELKPVQPSIIIREALKLLRASLPTTIEIHQDIRDDSLVMGDPTQIHQILMNLCTNAGHAMQENGGVLKVSLENIELDSDHTAMHPDLKPGPYLKLTVSDTGHGMTPALLERIYDPFFTTKEKGEGTGMGLSVVHGIVKSHGGTIDAGSELGKGSRFRIFLPIIKRKIEPMKELEKPIPKGSEDILFIDDEQPLVDITKELLESLGYNVTTRTSSTEALELFKAKPERYDLVITDMTMPKMTGDILAEKLIAIRTDVPIILCTGFSTRVDEEKARSVGIRALVMKPIVKREIANIIRKILDQ